MMSAVVFFAADANATMEGVRVSTPDTCWYSGNFINLPVSIEWTSWSIYNDCGAEYFVPEGKPYYHDDWVCYPRIYPCTQSKSCTWYTSPDEELCSFELTMTFNPHIMQAVTVTSAKLLDDWHFPELYFEINNNSGTITIAGASANCHGLTCITDPTELLYVGFLITGSAGQWTGLRVKDFTYNEVDPMYIYWHNQDYTGGLTDARSIGEFLVCQFQFLSGWVNYCSNGLPVCDAKVILTNVPDPGVVDPPDIPPETVLTRCENDCDFDCRGSYIMTDITDNYDYTLCAWKDNEYMDAISAFDASLILRYLVNQVYFNCCQMVAADVSGNNDVSGYDASLILKYLVGEFQYFPKKRSDNTNWIFFLEECCDGYGGSNCLPPIECYEYDPLTHSYTNQDFQAVVLGDVSGNWSIPKLRPMDVNDICQVKAVASDRNSTVYEITADFGDAYAYQFELRGSAEMIQIQPADENSGWYYQVNQNSDRVLVAAAGATPNHKSLPVRIVVDNNAPDVNLENLIINESRIPGSLALKSAALPTQYELSNNYPNPFNPETHISFSLPAKSEVTLSVYNVLGQHVKALASGAFEAGTHEVVWDGTNDSGENVTSGIYLYRLEAGDYLETKKMVLLK